MSELSSRLGLAVQLAVLGLAAAVGVAGVVAYGGERPFEAGVMLAMALSVTGIAGWRVMRWYRVQPARARVMAPLVASRAAGRPVDGALAVWSYPIGYWRKLGLYATLQRFGQAAFLGFPPSLVVSLMPDGWTAVERMTAGGATWALLTVLGLLAMWIERYPPRGERGVATVVISPEGLLVNGRFVWLRAPRNGMEYVAPDDDARPTFLSFKLRAEDPRAESPPIYVPVPHGREADAVEIVRRMQ